MNYTYYYFFFRLIVFHIVAKINILLPKLWVLKVPSPTSAICRDPSCLNFGGVEMSTILSFG
jgi:hypothetical protein